jgi:hypothetical protein
MSHIIEHSAFAGIRIIVLFGGKLDIARREGRAIGKAVLMFSIYLIVEMNVLSIDPI